jgi:hypothetical protein
MINDVVMRKIEFEELDENGDGHSYTGLKLEYDRQRSQEDWPVAIWRAVSTHLCRT